MWFITLQIHAFLMVLLLRRVQESWVLLVLRVHVIECVWNPEGEVVSKVHSLLWILLQLQMKLKCRPFVGPIPDHFRSKISLSQHLYHHCIHPAKSILSVWYSHQPRGLVESRGLYLSRVYYVPISIGHRDVHSFISDERIEKWISTVVR